MVVTLLQISTVFLISKGRLRNAADVLALMLLQDFNAIQHLDLPQWHAFKNGAMQNLLALCFFRSLIRLLPAFFYDFFDR